jgi:hypothetical protein
LVAIASRSTSRWMKSALSCGPMLAEISAKPAIRAVTSTMRGASARSSSSARALGRPVSTSSSRRLRSSASSERVPTTSAPAPMAASAGARPKVSANIDSVSTGAASRMARPIPKVVPRRSRLLGLAIANRQSSASASGPSGPALRGMTPLSSVSAASAWNEHAGHHAVARDGIIIAEFDRGGADHHPLALQRRLRHAAGCKIDEAEARNRERIDRIVDRERSPGL